jgi:hypothetical protein
MPDLEREAQDLLIADEHIAAGQKRLSEHVRLAETLPPRSRERAAAEMLSSTLQTSLAQWERHREQILHVIDPARYPALAREAIAVVAVSPDEVERRLLPDVRRWRLKAEELRAAASRIHDSMAEQTFLRLSQDYDLLAERAEVRQERERKAKQPGAR